MPKLKRYPYSENAIDMKVVVNRELASKLSDLARANNASRRAYVIGVLQDYVQTEWRPPAVTANEKGGS